jgi:hypothetical protein
MARRLELGAGIAAGALALLALVVLAFAPLVPYCAPTASPVQNCGAVRYQSLALTDPEAAVWAYLFGLLLVSLVAAGGAIVEARYGLRSGALPLWVGALLLFFASVFTAGWVGLFYLPTVLALGVASYAALLRRLPRRG